ncbi:MAG: hypothetical protein KKA62_03050 [Nanoarchaeota archaeon]|nr:hypothetical protein [Nanoarchaeota archaeon]MBU1644009.1 hypothetical protein [Nanoarchaeota archaeon]MBU1976904.1 hypothetical protein [Nanoarchaeota archaeon]
MAIAVDLDEVLAYSLKSEIEWHNFIHGTNLKRDDFNLVEYWKIWGSTRDEAVKKILRYMNSDFFDAIEPVPGAVEGIDYLFGLDQLVVITGRTDEVEKKTIDWLEKYFPQKFTELLFANSYSSLGKLPSKKSDLCKLVGAHTIIDDSPSYATDCAKNGIRTVLFDNVWNQETILIPNMRRAYGWKGCKEKPGVINLIK